MSESIHLDPVPQGLRSKLIAIGVWGLLAFGYLWVTFASAQTKVGEPAALIFPPHWSARQALQAASSLDVALIDFGRMSNIAIVVPRTETALDPARGKGVILILNAAGAALCAATFQTTRDPV